MKIIEPSHIEIMRNLNCCWFGSYNYKKCMCHNRGQFKDCYQKEKQRLTKTEYTEVEIMEMKRQNDIAMKELKEAIYNAFNGAE